jgi:hypothetical protein
MSVELELRVESCTREIAVMNFAVLRAVVLFVSQAYTVSIETFRFAVSHPSRSVVPEEAADEKTATVLSIDSLSA